MKSTEEVSHLEIYGMLRELKAELEMSMACQSQERDKAQRQSDEIFCRLLSLEKRMAQVMILALAFTIAIPVCVELATGRLLHFGTPPKTRQLHKDIIHSSWIPQQQQSLPYSSRVAVK